MDRIVETLIVIGFILFLPLILIYLALSYYFEE
jgi:hypothetical protein